MSKRKRNKENKDRENISNAKIGMQQYIRSVMKDAGLTFKPVQTLAEARKFLTCQGKSLLYSAILNYSRDHGGPKTHEEFIQLCLSRRKAMRAGRKTFAAFKAFYETKAWQRLRYQALLKYGRKCACCQSVTGPFHVDHIKPRAKHPELELILENLQVLCEDCNMGKGGWDETNWRAATLP